MDHSALISHSKVFTQLLKLVSIFPLLFLANSLSLFQEDAILICKLFHRDKCLDATFYFKKSLQVDYLDNLMETSFMPWNSLPRKLYPLVLQTQYSKEIDHHHSLVLLMPVSHHYFMSLSIIFKVIVLHIFYLSFNPFLSLFIIYFIIIISGQ